MTIIDVSQRCVHVLCGNAPREASAEGRQDDEQVASGFGSPERIDASSSGLVMLAPSAPHRSRGDHFLHFIGFYGVTCDVLDIGLGPHDLGDSHGMLGTRLRGSVRLSTRLKGYTAAANLIADTSA